jgi:membrane protein
MRSVRASNNGAQDGCTIAGNKTRALYDHGFRARRRTSSGESVLKNLAEAMRQAGEFFALTAEVEHRRMDLARELPMFKQVKRYGRSFVNLLWAAWIEYQRDRANYLGVAMIYYAMISLVPLLSLALSALGLLLRFSTTTAEFQEKTMATLEANFGLQLREMVEPLLRSLEQESLIASVISLGGLLWAASVLFHHLRMSFRAIWKYDPPLISGSVRTVVRTTILERTFSIMILLGGGGLLIIAVAVNATIQWVDRLLGSLALFDQGAGWWLGIPSSFILDIITFALLFKFLPPIPVRFRDVFPAAVLCALAWVVASQALSLSGALFSSGSAYGALGGLLAALLWMKLVSQILFFGAELCKVSGKRSEAQLWPAASASEPPEDGYEKGRYNQEPEKQW